MGVIYAQTLPFQPWHWEGGRQGPRPTQVPQAASWLASRSRGRPGQEQKRTGGGEKKKGPATCA